MPSVPTFLSRFRRSASSGEERILPATVTATPSLQTSALGTAAQPQIIPIGQNDSSVPQISVQAPDTSDTRTRPVLPQIQNPGLRLSRLPSDGDNLSLYRGPPIRGRARGSTISAAELRPPHEHPLRNARSNQALRNVEEGNGAPRENAARQDAPSDGEGGSTLLGRAAGRARVLSNAIAVKLGIKEQTDLDVDLPETDEAADRRAQYDQAVIDLLDVIDPEVSTLSTLADVQNSLFVPNLGRFVNRATYLRLAKPSGFSAAAELVAGGTDSAAVPPDSGAPASEKPKKTRWGFGTSKAPEPDKDKEKEKSKSKEKDYATSPPTTTDGRAARQAEEAAAHGEPLNDDASILARGEYLVMPDGLVDWENWTPEERAELDDYVRHLLHSRKWKARRTWRGFKQYVSTPLGAFVTIYATLLTFWGAAWVLFLIGWLNIGGADRRAYFIEICDQILTALFCLVGIGLAPFRTVDTYHLYWIAKYHRKTLELYKEQGLPPLPDENDLPDAERRPRKEDADIRPPVLSVEEQATLMYHQRRFTKSHTFYKPHETKTHRAFPLDLLITIVVLLDFHSLFQIALGTTTWSISYHHNYKKIITSVILSCSISCNISAGLTIAIGNRRTRKTDVVEDQLRRSVTEEAVRRKQRQRQEEIREREKQRKEMMENAGRGSGHRHGLKSPVGTKVGSKLHDLVG